MQWAGAACEALPPKVFIMLGHVHAHRFRPPPCSNPADPGAAVEDDIPDIMKYERAEALFGLGGGGHVEAPGTLTTLTGARGQVSRQQLHAAALMLPTSGTAAALKKTHERGLVGMTRCVVTRTRGQSMVSVCAWLWAGLETAVGVAHFLGDSLIVKSLTSL